MWYVMQTITGKEQELADVIWRVLTGERKKYERCFVLYQEYDRRSGGKLEACIEVLFPSYVFVETDAPEEFFLELKHIPKMSRLLGAEGFFWSINKEEELFLQRMLEKSDAGYDGIEEKSNKKNAKKKQEKSYFIRPSLVWTDETGEIKGANGILGEYLDKIVKQRLRKRSVVIEIPFCGKIRRMRLGIRLAGDKDEYGKDVQE